MLYVSSASEKRMSELRNRTSAADMDVLPRVSSSENARGQSERSSGNWIYIPALAILATLLLSTLYVLRFEQSRVVSQELTIRELKSQIGALRQEVVSAKSFGACSSGSVTKLQDEVHKLERVAESMKASKVEADKQLQEMINRVSALQAERNKLKSALRAMKQELNSAEDLRTSDT